MKAKRSKPRPRKQDDDVTFDVVASIVTVLLLHHDGVRPLALAFQEMPPGQRRDGVLIALGLLADKIAAERGRQQREKGRA